MSLLITSNTPKNGIQEEIKGLNRPFSFTNTLQGTLKIPKNSEIAVQSVKINKTGNALINKYNSQYAFYFGRNPESPKWDLMYDNNTAVRYRNASATDIQNNSISIPTYLVQPDTSGQRNFSMNTNDLASAIQKSMNKVLCHPNLLENACSTSNAGPRVIAIRNASAQGFTGFEWTINNSASGTNIEAKTEDLKWGNENIPVSPPSYIGQRLTNTIASFSNCFEKTYPLSLASGKFKVDLGNHKTGASYDEFLIGLSRSQYSSDPINNMGHPSYSRDGNFFYDYVVASEENASGKHEIKVYQFVGQSGLDDRNRIVPDQGVGCNMQEFEYYNNYNTSPPGNPLIWEDYQFTKVEFIAKNEQITIKLYNASGNASTLCTGAETSNTGKQNIKPICPTTRFLFPKIGLIANKYMDVEIFNGVKVKDFVYGECDHKDWWNQRNCDGNTTECQLLDEKLFYTRKGAQLFLNRKAFNNQVGLVNDRCAMSARLITAPSNVHYRTSQLNAQYIFGFIGNSIPKPLSGDLGSLSSIIFKSSAIPVLSSKESIFVRLRNFPIQSANFAKSSMSNIIYHVPTFSNSGGEIGSLHFEASEMVYLDINNVEDLFLSTVDVDLVYADETLAVGLEGKTVVVLHIRQKKD